MRIKILLVFLCSGMLCNAIAKDQETLKGIDERINYSLGYQIGNDLVRQDVTLNDKLLLKGLDDALGDIDSQLSSEEMETLLLAFKQRILTANEKYAAKRKNFDMVVEDNKAFLARNAAMEGVKITDSGLQYKVIKKGNGGSPLARDTVKVNYRSSRIDGTEFDSSYRKGGPVEIVVEKVIPGLSEGLQMMKEGGKRQLFIPPDLTYGRTGMLAHRAVIFEVELIAITAKGKYEAGKAK